MARPHARKGASRNANTNKNYLEKFSLTRFLLAASLVVLALVMYGSFSAVQTVLDVPVSQVDVQGSFHYLSESDVNRVINAYVDNGFVSVDLENLRAEFLALPWVHQASIRRQLPNGLRVNLVEQVPIAYWNGKAMINDAGEVFSPASIPVIAGLPLLEGTNHQTVLSLFEALKQHLPARQQPVRRLKVSESHVVRAEIGSGTVLIFNAGDVVAKMEIWKTISAGELADRLDDVEYADLRYSNGAAVRFRQASSNDKQGELNGK